MNRFIYKDNKLYDKIEDKFISVSDLCNLYQKLYIMFRDNKNESFEYFKKLIDVEDDMIILRNKYMILNDRMNDVIVLKNMYQDDLSKYKNKLNKADLKIKQLIKENEYLNNELNKFKINTVDDIFNKVMGDNNGTKL